MNKPMEGIRVNVADDLPASRYDVRCAFIGSDIDTNLTVFRLSYMHVNY